MWLRLEKAVRCTVLVLALYPALGVASPPPFKDNFPVTSRSALMPVSKLERGQRGVGYTVFSGGTIESFNVEILGVLDDYLGPKNPLILAKLTGDKIEFSGVIAGMSGSPVFIDGRLVGAVGYSFSKFQKEAIAGITPIHSMLAAGGLPDLRNPRGARGTRGRGKLSYAHLRSRPKLPEIQLPISLPASPVLPGKFPARGAQASPIAAPMILEGFGPKVRGAWAFRLRNLGFQVQAGGAGPGELPGPFRPREPAHRSVRENRASMSGLVEAPRIAPGGPIGVVLMRGDVSMWSFGTVTMVEGDAVYAFGHPFHGLGRVRFPMATASVLNTLASWADSFKQASLGLEVGEITQDRLPAVVGQLGQVAPMVPVRVALIDPQTRAVVERRVEIVDDPDWLPPMLEAAITSCASERVEFEAGGTVDFLARVHVGDRTIEYRDTYSLQSPFAVAAFVARDVGISVGSIMQNPIAPVTIRGIEVELSAAPHYEATRILAVEPTHHVVQAGTALDLSVTLLPHRSKAQSGPQKVRMTVPIPEDASGTLELVIGGGVELDRQDAWVRGTISPTTVDQYLAQVVQRRPARGIFGRLIIDKPGVVKNGELMTALPPSQRAVLLSPVDSQTRRTKRALGPAVKVPYPTVIVGSIKVKLTAVDKFKR